MMNGVDKEMKNDGGANWYKEVGMKSYIYISTMLIPIKLLKPDAMITLKLTEAEGQGCIFPNTHPCTYHFLF
jgi:hypothetical protein